MSDAKFASITSALLVRKGEAAPSVISVMPPPAMSAPFVMPVIPRPKAAARKVERHEEHVSTAGDRKRRVVITLTSEEYQRLGIIAAKRDSTRHDMVRDVLFVQLDAYAREQAANCACINSATGCDCAGAGEGEAGAASDSSEAAASLHEDHADNLEAAY